MYIEQIVPKYIAWIAFLIHVDGGGGGGGGGDGPSGIQVTK